MKKEELLYKYFLDELSPKELERFNVLLEADKAFKEQFEFEKSVRRVTRKEERTTMKSKLQELEKELQQPVRPKWFSWPVLRIAASVAIIISLGLYFYYVSNFTVDMEALYAVHYEKYPNTVYVITRGDLQNNSPEQMAFGAYEAEDHTKAIQLFTTLKEEKQPIYIDFYLAQSYLRDGQIENAITFFKRVIADRSDFTAESQWYLALAHLKSGDEKNAVRQLEEIVSGNGYKAQEAGKLLEKLD